MSQDARHAVHRCRAKNGSKLLLLVLAEFDKPGSDQCWADEKTLADMCSMSVRQVQRCIQACVKDGYLEIVNEPRWQDGRRLSRDFRLKLGDISDGVGRHFCPSDETSTQRARQKCRPKYTTEKYTTNADANEGADKPPELTLVKESNSLPSGKTKNTSQRKREDVLGKGLSDDEWMARLAVQYPHINIPALFDRCLGWCRDKGKVASRRQFMAFVRNAKEDRPMQVTKPQPVGQSAWDRELAEIRRAAGE